MYHMTYLAGICQRRNWPEPLYQISLSRSGYHCTVRVNNREYQTSKYHTSEMSAREAAATTAYSICLNFSANDGMYPAGFASNGVIQGNPVPVGSGRHGRRGDSGSGNVQYVFRDASSSPDYSDLGIETRHASERRASRHQPSPSQQPYRHEPQPRNRHGGRRH